MPATECLLHFFSFFPHPISGIKLRVVAMEHRKTYHGTFVGGFFSHNLVGKNTRTLPRLFGKLRAFLSHKWCHLRRCMYQFWKEKRSQTEVRLSEIRMKCNFRQSLLKRPHNEWALTLFLLELICICRRQSMPEHSQWINWAKIVATCWIKHHFSDIGMLPNWISFHFLCFSVWWHSFGRLCF